MKANTQKILTYVLAFAMMFSVANTACAASVTEESLTRKIDMNILKDEMYAEAEGNETSRTQFIYQVLDRLGAPVEGAKVTVEVFDERGESKEHTYLTEMTDENGMVIINDVKRKLDRIYNVTVEYNDETVIASYENGGRVINWVAEKATNAGVKKRRLYGTVKLKELSSIQAEGSFLQFAIHVTDKNGKAASGAEVVVTLHETDGGADIAKDYTVYTNEYGVAYLYDAPEVTDIDYADFLDTVKVTYKKQTVTEEYYLNVDMKKTYIDSQGLEKRLHNLYIKLS